MPINFDNALGIHEYALKLHEQRAEMLASNLANADTPGYKARDIDFHSLLKDYAGDGPLATTNSRQFSSASGANSTDGVMYRNPVQPSIDGNTVDTEVEKTQFMQNALEYQATLSFIDRRFKGLMTAIKGV